MAVIFGSAFHKELGITSECKAFLLHELVVFRAQEIHHLCPNAIVCTLSHCPQLTIVQLCVLNQSHGTFHAKIISWARRLPGTWNSYMAKSITI